jgi:hypothetical protein
MSTCSVPADQPIYQALLDKAASYPADKPYQAKAYKKAAKFIATYGVDICRRGNWWFFAPENSGIGYRIEEFINEFIEANPQPAVPSNPMDAARVFAAASAPKMTTVWPNDASERAAFQQKVAASKADDPAKVVELPSVHPALAPLRTTMPKTLERRVACGGTLTYCGCAGCPDNTIKSDDSVKLSVPIEPPKPLSTSEEVQQSKE